ncbi:MAG TPA: phosphate ABC transporter permease PstA [Verrucomicrobiae bacterium]|nr:phosphate ABC transporter permease PstA [Verrucomicrobiae bacterium]
MNGFRVARYIRSGVGTFLSGLCAGAAALVLLLILGYVAIKGIHAINLPFLTQLPVPVGESGGGVANGIVGSFITVGIATLIATPIGILTGILVALFGRGLIAEGIRFLSDVLSGIPSIAIGLFAYTLFVEPFRHFSALSASFAFALLMLPLIIRTSEEAIRSVPQVVREGALALGMSVYRSTMYVVLPAARPAIVTGLLLGIARITGETAPLLFTAFGSQFWELNPSNPMAELSLQIFTYAIGPYQSWHEQAWAGALLLIFAVFVLNVVARLVLRPGGAR